MLKKFLTFLLGSTLAFRKAAKRMVFTKPKDCQIHQGKLWDRGVEIDLFRQIFGTNLIIKTDMVPFFSDPKRVKMTSALFSKQNCWANPYSVQVFNPFFATRCVVSFP